MALGFQFSEKDPLTRLRIRYVLVLLVLGMAASLWTLAAGLVNVEADERLLRLAGAGSFLIIGAGLLFQVRRQGQIMLATWVLVLGTAFAAIGYSTGYFLVALISVTTASALAGWPLYILANVLVFGKGIYDLIQLQNSGASVDNVIFNLIAVVIVSLTTRLFIVTAERTSQAARRTNNLLEASAEIGQTIGKLLNVDELLNQAVNLIRERFAFYHVQIFLLDEHHEFAVLTASTGEAGKRLLERKHRLMIGSQSVIGRVAQIGEPVIAYSKDSVHARNELLPNTESELAIPILDGDQVIGALDVQSTQRDAFGEVDIQALQVMANQLSISIRNASLFAEQASSLQENKRLFFESETNLREIQRLNQQFTKSAWNTYLKEQQAVSGITLQNGNVLAEDTWSKTMVEAGQRRRPITEATDGQKAVAVPILLRGELLGAIEIEGTGDTQDKEVAEMLQAVAQRLAISLDRARLFEEAQETSAQQQRINEIVGQYQAAGTIDDLLQITLTELSATLGAQRSMIRLGGPPKSEAQNGAAR